MSLRGPSTDARRASVARTDDGLAAMGHVQELKRNFSML